MEVRIRQQRLPGIGHRYELPVDDDRVLILVVRHEGGRQLSIGIKGADEPTSTVMLGQDQAVAVAAILTGARFSIEGDAPAGPDRDVAVETATLSDRSPAIGRLVRDVSLRAGSDAAILAIIRDDTPQVVEDDDTEPCRPGDRLVVAAPRDRLVAVVRELAG